MKGVAARNVSIRVSAENEGTSNAKQVGTFASDVICEPLQPSTIADKIADSGKSGIKQSAPEIMPPPDLKDAKLSPCCGKDIGELLFESLPPMTDKREQGGNNARIPIRGREQTVVQQKQVCSEIEVITVAEGIENIRLSERRNFARAESFEEVDEMSIVGYEEDLTMRTNNRSGVVPQNPFDPPKQDCSSNGLEGNRASKSTQQESQPKASTGQSRTSVPPMRAAKPAKKTLIDGGYRFFFLLIGCLMAASGLWSSPSATRLVDNACGPVAYDTFLGPGDATYSSPWILPAKLKSVDALFNLVCGDRPQMQLDWTLQKQTKKQNLYQVVVSELKREEVSVEVAKMKNVVSANVNERGILIRDRKGVQHILRAPWQASQL